MITRIEVIKKLEVFEDFMYDKSDDMVYFDQKRVKLDDLVRELNIKNHSYFEHIYDSSKMYFSILKCHCCGTIIEFKYDKEYEADLKCPTCTNFKTRNQYYTKEEIDGNQDLQKEIELFYQLSKEENKKNLKNSKIVLKSLKYFVNKNTVNVDIQTTNTLNNRYGGLSLLYTRYRELEKNTYILAKQIEIPLSIKSAKLLKKKKAYRGPHMI